ncbi:gamma tubulin complex Spc97/GCP2 subunit Alp4 [Coemansia sp. IMI 203386]|nr:gamma tubulin complex Spc97/GCP2 subunit Alp4 [Coemansia sp. IMI 203386]
MALQEYEYGDDFVEVKRVSYAGNIYGSSDLDLEKAHSRPLNRRLKRDRAESVSFSPQDTYGEPTHSEVDDSLDEVAHFNNKLHQFESSFRNPRGRERAPLPTRMWDMHSSLDVGRPMNDPQDSYDDSIQMQPLPEELQEAAVMEDLLSLLMGFNGRYLSFNQSLHPKAWRMAIDARNGVIIPGWMSPTLQSMVERFIPLVLMHKRVKYFTTTYSQRQAGVVNQALCAAIVSLIKDFYSHITTLENLVRLSTKSDPYTLPKMWQHLYPKTQTFERLVHLVDDIQKVDLPRPKQPPSASKLGDIEGGFATAADDMSNRDAEGAEIAEDGMPESEQEDSDEEEYEHFPDERFVVRGGYTLNIISDMIRFRGGDISSRQLYEYLLTKASVPFMQMLSHWLNTGELEDSKSDMAGEFMVCKDGDGVTGRTFIDADGIEDFGGKSIMPNTDNLCYVSIAERTPAFLRPYADKIVRTGEYLNMLRAYGVDLRALELKPAESADSDEMDRSSDISMANARALQLSEGSPNGLLNPQMLMREIDQAYQRANRALLDILFKDGKIMAYMSAVKRYMLFEKSDFLTHFLDLAKDETGRQQKDMSTSRLQSFLDLALLNPASVSHDDPLKDIVKVTIDTVELVDALKMINATNTSDQTSFSSTSHRISRDVALTPAMSARSGSTGVSFLGTSLVSDDFMSGNMFIGLQLQIPFPIDIVLDKVSMKKYKVLNRLLMALKQTEQNLVSSWLTSLQFEDQPFAAASGQKALGSAKIEGLRRKVLISMNTMRHRILVCIQQMMHYYFWDVIEPQWEKMTELMRKSKTVDELCSIHTQHLDTILRKCGLNATKLPKVVVKLLERSNRFNSLVNTVVSKPALFRIANTASEKNTVAGRLLAEMNKDSMNPETQQHTLSSFNESLVKYNVEWLHQLNTVVRALNHYARKYDESYLTLAVRLDCNQGDESSIGN